MSPLRYMGSYTMRKPTPTGRIPSWRRSRISRWLDTSILLLKLNNDQSFPLMDLPPELRLSIYCAYFTIAGSNKECTNLLAVSRTINKEAKEIFIRHHAFRSNRMILETINQLYSLSVFCAEYPEIEPYIHVRSIRKEDMEEIERLEAILEINRFPTVVLDWHFNPPDPEWGFYRKQTRWGDIRSRTGIWGRIVASKLSDGSYFVSVDGNLLSVVRGTEMLDIKKQAMQHERSIPGQQPVSWMTAEKELARQKRSMPVQQPESQATVQQSREITTPTRCGQTWCRGISNVLLTIAWSAMICGFGFAYFASIAVIFAEQA